MNTNVNVQSPNSRPRTGGAALDRRRTSARANRLGNQFRTPAGRGRSTQQRRRPRPRARSAAVGQGRNRALTSDLDIRGRNPNNLDLGSAAGFGDETPGANNAASGFDSSINRVILTPVQDGAVRSLRTLLNSGRGTATPKLIGKLSFFYTENWFPPNDKSLIFTFKEDTQQSLNHKVLDYVDVI